MNAVPPRSAARRTAHLPRGAALLAALLVALPVSCRKMGGFPLPVTEDDSPIVIAPPPSPELDGAAPVAGGWYVDDPGTPPFSTRKLLDAFATCAATGIDVFVERAHDLEAATAAYAADASPENRDVARRAWGEAMDLWQELEVFQFGPAAMRGQPGGLELRAEIYVWPLFNPCLVDNYLVRGEYAGDQFPGRYVHTRGLGTLEYLLFYTGEQNSCASTNPINRDGTWIALVQSGLAQPRADYAAAAAGLIAAQAEALAAAWSPAGGNFREVLVGAEAGNDVYPSPQEALNAVSDALFYLDTETKDMKLAQPLGDMDCGAETCLTESRFSGWSKRNIRNNLLGFRRLFSGCNDGEGFGFDDLLVSKGQGALAADMQAALDQAIRAVDWIESPTLEAALATDWERVENAHTAIRAVTTALKTTFVSVLSLRLPKSAETDND
jgi:uncharacterized protein